MVVRSDYFANFVNNDEGLADDIHSFRFNYDNAEIIMKKITFGKHIVEYYDSIDELPVVRFHKWQKFVMIDSGIGADISAFDQHIEKARRYVKLGQADNAEKELMNLRQSVYFIQNELSPAHLAFAALVKSLDGKECTDTSDNALQELCRRFAEFNIDELAGEVGSVKKKINDELILYFPKIFADSDVKEYYTLMRQRMMLVLDGIIKGAEAPDETAEVEIVNDKLILYSNPRVFQGSEGVEIQFDKQFENLCIVLAQKLNIEAKTKTVLEFYNAFEYISQTK